MGKEGELPEGSVVKEYLTAADDGKPVWQRMMRTKPSPNYDAGDRTGRLPRTLGLNYPETPDSCRRSRSRVSGTALPVNLTTPSETSVSHDDVGRREAPIC
jgi:hypothetical protein